MGTLQNLSFTVKESNMLLCDRIQQVEHYTLQINEVKEQLRKKTSDFNKIQDGMREIKEFQKKKVQMEQELIDVRNKNSLKCFLLRLVVLFC